MPLSHDAIEYIIHHVVLPPQLPAHDDYSAIYESDLRVLVIASLVDLKESCVEEHLKTVEFAISTITNLGQCRKKNSTQINQAKLKKTLATLADGWEAMVPLEVQMQNAAILISRCDEAIIFEYFELTPTNEAAMGQGRLIRAFPAFASKIPATLAKDSDLQNSIADTITTLASETAPHFHPPSPKSPSPGLVTDFFMNITTALGETVDVTRISKNTREEVITKGRGSLWRRSPTWLLIRVTLHLVFSRRSIEEHYKAFMVLLLSRIIDSVCNSVPNPHGKHSFFPYRTHFPLPN